jgi:cell division septum initiation protein DivIVA
MLSPHQSMTTVAGATIFGPVHDNGTFTPASAVPAPPAVLSDPVDLTAPAFPTVRKGYEPAAVDGHFALFAASVSALRTALADSERRRAMAEQHAVAVEEEIRVVRSGLTPAADTGFGARAERMLRLAETEAEQIRSTARRTAAEVTERARNEAERHRHDVRQQLIAERARTEQQAHRSTAELQEREDALDDRLAHARAEADALAAAAERAADAHRAAAQADVDELRRRTADELARARALAERELSRLRDLQAGAGVELARIAAAIRTELAPRATGVVRPSPRPSRRSEAAPAEGPDRDASDDNPHRYADALAAR